MNYIDRSIDSNRFSYAKWNFRAQTGDFIHLIKFFCPRQKSTNFTVPDNNFPDIKELLIHLSKKEKQKIISCSSKKLQLLRFDVIFSLRKRYGNFIFYSLNFRKIAAFSNPNPNRNAFVHHTTCEKKRKESTRSRRKKSLHSSLSLSSILRRG